MKSKNLISALSFLLVISFISCKKDPSPPTISNFELGYHNNKIAYQGGELHMDADIVAEAKIDRIEIEIHHEGDHKKSFTMVVHEEEWEFDTTYVKFNGLKNASFHEHIDVPHDAETGEYHFHFKVIDMEGNVAEVEDEFEIKEPEV